MRRTREVCRALSLLLMLGAALTLGISLTQGQDGEQARPPEGMAEVKPPMPMPAFSLPGVNGAPLNSSALQGRVVVVRFWATW